MHTCGTVMEMEVKVFATNQAHENHPLDATYNVI
jgi:hypothetical protein